MHTETSLKKWVRAFAVAGNDAHTNSYSYLTSLMPSFPVLASALAILYSLREVELDQKQAHHETIVDLLVLLPYLK